jgi:hypothetical protein
MILSYKTGGPFTLRVSLAYGIIRQWTNKFHFMSLGFAVIKNMSLTTLSLGYAVITLRCHWASPSLKIRRPSAADNDAEAKLVRPLANDQYRRRPMTKCVSDYNN